MTQNIGARVAAFALLALCFAAVPGALAREAQRDEPARAEVAPVSNEPQQTSATYGDWVVRCDRPAQGPRRLCEVAQSLVIKGQQSPIAQIAFGHAPSDASDSSLIATVLLPVNVAFDKPPRIGAGAVPATGAEDASATMLTFRRCVQGGCFADATLDATFVAALRDAKTPGHLTFADAAEHTIALPVSLRGLTQALDDLGRERAKDKAVK